MRDMLLHVRQACPACRLGLAHKVAVHKQRQKERSQDKPWHLSRKSDAANLVLMDLLQEHEFL